MESDISKVAIGLVVAFLVLLAASAGFSVKANHDEIQEISNEVTTLVSEGYSMNVEGNPVTRMPDVSKYNIEINDDTKTIYMTTKAPARRGTVVPVIVPLT